MRLVPVRMKILQVLKAECIWETVARDSGEERESEVKRGVQSMTGTLSILGGETLFSGYEEGPKLGFSFLRAMFYLFICNPTQLCYIGGDLWRKTRGHVRFFCVCFWWRTRRVATRSWVLKLCDTIHSGSLHTEIHTILVTQLCAKLCNKRN